MLTSSLVLNLDYTMTFSRIIRLDRQGKKPVLGWYVKSTPPFVFPPSTGNVEHYKPNSAMLLMVASLRLDKLHSCSMA